MSINQDVRGQYNPSYTNNPYGHVPDILKLKAGYSQLGGAGPPAYNYGSIGDAYVDTSTKQHWKKTLEGEWVHTFKDTPSGGGGTITGAGNLGAGEPVYDTVTGGDTLQFKTLTAGSGIELTSGPQEISISATGGGGGTITGASNLGSGEGVFQSVVTGDTIALKSLVQGSNVTLTSTTDTIEISASTGETITASNVGLPAYTGLFKAKVLSDLQFKTMYTLDGGLLEIGTDIGGDSVYFLPRSLQTYSGTLLSVGSANGTIYWTTGTTASPAVSSAHVVDGSLKKLFKITAKLLYNDVWSFSSGTMVLDVGYFPPNQPVTDLTFVSLISIPLPVTSPNLNVVWTYSLSPLPIQVPVLSGLACRLINTAVVSTAPNADIDVSITVSDL